MALLLVQLTTETKLQYLNAFPEDVTAKLVNIEILPGESSAITTEARRSRRRICFDKAPCSPCLRGENPWLRGKTMNPGSQPEHL